MFRLIARGSRSSFVIKRSFSSQPTFKSMGVIGAGQMGGGIALVASQVRSKVTSDFRLRKWM